MSDTVTVVWAGPFVGHDVNGRAVHHGDQLEVTPYQAKNNPGWYQPIKAAKTHAPAEKADS